jgi:hypothetical protein
MKTAIALLHLITVLLFAAFDTQAQQPPVKQWDVRYGGSLEDSLTSVCPSADGGFLAGGFSRSPAGGDVAENSKGGADYWVVKLDSSGAKMWDRRYGGDKDDFLYAVRCTPDGGFLLGGYSFSGISGDRTQGSRGQCDYWIVKIDAGGNKQWEARYGGKTFDYLFDMKVTQDGGYILGGYTDSKNSGDVTEAGRGANDYWMVKTDASGVKQWDKRFGGGSDDNLSSIIQSADGGYVLGGLTHSKLEDGGDITEGVIGGKDYWVVKTDGSGNKIWDNRLGGTDRDIMNDMIQVDDGGYMCAGLTASLKNNDVSETPRGAEDYWLVKLDSDGYKVWDRRFGGASSDVGTFVTSMVDGNLLTCGHSQSGISGDKTESSEGKQDYWLIKTSFDGNKIWDADFGGKSGDALWEVCLATDGGWILGGSSRSGPGADKSQPSQGATDFWIVKTAPELVTWYADQDHDGYGATTLDSVSVFQPAGYVASGNDCDDSNALVNPATAELCNGMDENCNFIIDDNAFAVTITPSGTVNSCEGASVLFTAAGTGITAYQWYRDGVAVSGQTNSTFSTKLGTSVYVAVTGSNGCIGQSAATAIIRNALPPAMILFGNNGNADLCNGSVELKVPGAELRTWQWNLNGVAIAGATDNKYYPDDAGSYSVVVTNTTTGCSKTSAPVTILKSCRLGEAEAGAVQIYPNPAGEMLHVQLNENVYTGVGSVKVEILNALGCVLHSEDFAASENFGDINLRQNSISRAGVYQIRISSQGHFFILPFIIQ